MPLVSVVVPVFNGERYLRAALDSVLAQTCGDHELVVVDDGSNDGTAAIIASFADRVRAVAQTNQGHAVARNRGAAVARGRYLAFLDADDLWEPTFLERSLRVANEEASFCGWRYVDASGCEVPRLAQTPRRAVGLHELALWNRFPPSAMLVGADLFRRVGGFEESPAVAEDWDFCLRLAATGAVFRAVAEVLCGYRLHQGNVSRDPDRARARFLSTLARFYGRPDLPGDVAALRARATAHALMETSARFAAAGREADARRDFVAAVQWCRDALSEDDAFYTALCACQPRELKATAEGLDLESASRRVVAMLRDCAADGVLDPAGLAAATARLHRVSALLAYVQIDCGRTRRDALRAVRASPGLLADGRLAAAFLKSFLGAAALRRWRRRRREAEA